MLTAIFVFSASAVCGIAAWFGGRKRERDEPTDEVRKENRALKRENKELQAMNEYLMSFKKNSIDAVIDLTKQRDEYRRIAETHDVRYVWPETKTENTRERVWDKRIYGGHPRDNLDAIEQDLKAFKDCDVIIEIRFEPKGEWVKPWDKSYIKNRILAREGPPERVIRELRTTLTDPVATLTRLDDTPTPTGQQPGFHWRSEVSPFRFLVTCDITKKTTVEPIIHTVEVLRVQEEVRVVEVERVVFHEPNEERVAATQQQQALPDALDIKAMIEIGVAEELARRLGTTEATRAHDSRAAQVAAMRVKQ